MSSSATNSQILDKHILPACDEGNGYVFRDAQRKGRWCLYFINKSNGSRHRIVLKEGDGRYPNPSLDGVDDAKRLGIRKYFDLKKKINIEKIKALKSEGLGATAIAKQVGCHRDSVYRLLKRTKLYES